MTFKRVGKPCPNGVLNNLLFNRLLLNAFHTALASRPELRLWIVGDGTERGALENLAQELLRRIAPGMPGNVESVGVYVYEGLNKGTHLLAQVHRREVERGIEKKSRKKGREPPRRRR